MRVLWSLGGISLGVCVGMLSGLIGLGGGALIVPALIWFYGLPQRDAQGTSIATLVLPVGLLACKSYYQAGHVDLKLAVLLAIGFSVGGWLGGLWAQQLPEVVLRRIFAGVLCVIAMKLALTR